MLTIQEYYTIFLQNLRLLYWQDILEILFCSTITYYFLIWLKSDTQKNLISLFYTYCLLLFAAYYTQLFTISYILYAGAPIILILFIILHQDILQKNFIMLRRPQALLSDNKTWFDELIRSCLHALHNNKEITYVIERNDQLKDIISASCIFYADIKKELCDMLFEKHDCTPNQFVWINQDGKLIAINAAWKLSISEDWINPQIAGIAKWKQDSILITTKTDALVFKMIPLTRTIDIIIQGKMVNGLSPQQAFSVLQEYLVAKNTINSIFPLQKNTAYHEHNK